MDNKDISLENQIYHHTDILAIDSGFMHILDFKPVAGTLHIVRPEDALVTEDFARKVFGKENPIGKKLHYPDAKKEITVIGVIGKPQAKSSISFDVLVSSQLTSNWYGVELTLILLYPGVNYKDINRQYGEFMDVSGNNIRYQLYPYKDVYFENNILYSLYENGNFRYVIILSVVGILLLLIGTVNYINIYTVVILRRNREFGMKKVFGAEGFKVFYQLLFENLILIASSMVVALGLSELLSPSAENIFGFEQFPNAGFTLALALVLLLALPLVTSIMPFLRYHYASPVRSLQSVIISGKSLFSRRFFLTFQYFITMVMIMVSLFFIKQLHFMLHQDLGYRTQNIIKVPFIKLDIGFKITSKEERDNREKILDELKQKLNASTLIEHWTCGFSPNEGNGHYSHELRIQGGEFQAATKIETDETWLKLFEIKLINGRLWDNSIDDFHNYVIIMTESALKQYEITDYREVGLEPSISPRPPSDHEASQNSSYQIIGVVKDIYTTHLSQKQRPITITFAEANNQRPVIASFAPGRRKEVIEFMKNLHEELVGGEFSYSFVEDEVAEVYKEDKKVAVIYSVFTVIAILISILGLFGLSLFDIRQRRKEIAIRKVNGALTKDIILLLLNKYFVLLGIGFAISVPVALFAIHKYLDNFAFQASVSWWLFAVALIVTAAVSLLTLIYQTYKASNENPADVLKSE
jgi:ABC-type antimicrobial peptide transport system permease subunit